MIVRLLAHLLLAITLTLGTGTLGADDQETTPTYIGDSVLDLAARSLTATLMDVYRHITNYASVLALFTFIALFTAGMFGRFPWGWLYSAVSAIFVLSYSGVIVGHFTDQGNAKVAAEEYGTVNGESIPWGTAYFMMPKMLIEYGE